MEKKINRVAVFWGILFVFSVGLVSGGIACTLGGITGSATFQHEVFIGQTCDNAWWPTRHTVWVIQPENGYKYLGSKAAIWGFWTGVNEKGFAWAGAAVSARDKADADPNGPGLLEIGPMLLEKCVTVYDAIEFLENHPRKDDFPTRNAIMADAQGNLALVEISYAKINVETLTTDGYVVRTNHYTSDVMAPLGYTPGASSLERLERGYEWFENWFTENPSQRKNKMHIEDLFSPKDGFWSYVYEPLQGSLTSGPGTVIVMQPMELTYWFAYGWPGGNLPTKENELRQICQNMTWGAFIPFYLPEMVPGQYTTELGQLTPLGIQYVVSHFSRKLQSTPAWVNYQSDDPMQPYYKPAEDMSPSGYTKKENPFGPGGFVGTWSGSTGFVPCPSCP
jgi:hypothetical protein